jgi:hypothetical protein
MVCGWVEGIAGGAIQEVKRTLVSGNPLRFGCRVLVLGLNKVKVSGFFTVGRGGLQIKQF